MLPDEHGALMPDPDGRAVPRPDEPAARLLYPKDGTAHGACLNDESQAAPESCLRHQLVSDARTSRAGLAGAPEASISAANRSNSRLTRPMSRGFGTVPASRWKLAL